VLEVLWVAIRLGLTSFGGPIAHLGYFRREYVERRRWLDEASYADLVAPCQFLPGPASSQLGIAIGTRRAGMTGGVAAWLGFTLPSAIALVLFGLVTGSVDRSRTSTSRTSPTSIAASGFSGSSAAEPCSIELQGTERGWMDGASDGAS